MDIKRSINTKVWNDPWFEELSSSEKLIWLYLLSNQYSNLLGIYEISFRRISYDTNLDIETIRNGFEGFGMVRKAFYIDGYVVVINWLKNQNLNANMLKCVKSLFTDLPESLKKKINDLGFTLTIPNGLTALESNKLFNTGYEVLKDNLNPSEPFRTITEPFRTIVPIEIEIEIEIEREIEKEMEGENENHSPFDFFLKQNEILNSANSEFLNSEMWFETKAMQLNSKPEIIRESSKEFILDLRDRDILEGKDLTGLRSHFVSWFKKRGTAKQPNGFPMYIPNIEDR